MIISVFRLVILLFGLAIINEKLCVHEDEEASATLTSPQHSSDCTIMIAYRKWEAEMMANDNSALNHDRFMSLGVLVG